MSGEGFVSADPYRAARDAADDAILAAIAEGSARQREADAAMIEALADRLLAGPGKRESWEAPINLERHDPAFAKEMATLLRATASSIRAGLAEDPSERTEHEA